MVRHPLIDDVVGSTLVVDSQAPVIWLTEAMATLLTRAHDGGRMVVLRTGPGAALTPALRHALGASGAGWVVRAVDGTLRDGRTGVAIAGIEEYARRGPDLVGTPSPEHPDATNTVTQVGVDLTLRHHPGRAVDVGSAVEALCEAADCCPTRWGTSEPLTAPWDRWVATQYAKHTAPGVSTSFAAGDGVSATMTAHMTGGMVVETMSATVTATDDGVEQVLDAVRRIAEVVVPVFGVVMRRRGDADLLVRAASYGEPVPAAVVVGPEATTFLDRNGMWPPPGTRVETFAADDQGAHGLLIRLDSGWDALEAFLDLVDEERFATLVSGEALEGAAADGVLDDVHSHEAATHEAATHEAATREAATSESRSTEDLRSSGGQGAA